MSLNRRKPNEKPYEAVQRRLFNEYRLKNANPSKEMVDELARWEGASDTIRGMPLEEQATYADYVTRGTCEQPMEILEDLIIDTMDTLLLLAEKPQKLGTCAIGNIALVIKSIPEEDKSVAARGLFKEILEHC